MILNRIISVALHVGTHVIYIALTVRPLHTCVSNVITRILLHCTCTCTCTYAMEGGWDYIHDVLQPSQVKWPVTEKEDVRVRQESILF